MSKKKKAVKKGNISASVVKTSAKPKREVVEFIPEAEKQGFRVIVDYAFEPVALEALYKVVEQLKPNRVIHVLGSCGGGRDTAARPIKGRFAAERAEVVIVTNEDPYDDDPMEIIEEVARGAGECKIKNVKCKMVELLKILDRREAIGKALSLAQAGDIVLITGKGSEQGMVVKGKIVSWDDRKIVRELLQIR